MKLVGVVLLKSLPLAAALFLLFPRLNAPLWGLPGDTTTGRTGLSTTMTPGAIGRLLESDEIAFRALFSGNVPLNDQSAWAVVTLPKDTSTRAVRLTFTRGSEGDERLLNL